MGALRPEHRQREVRKLERGGLEPHARAAPHRHPPWEGGDGACGNDDGWDQAEGVDARGEPAGDPSRGERGVDGSTGGAGRGQGDVGGREPPLGGERPWSIGGNKTPQPVTEQRAAAQRSARTPGEPRHQDEETAKRRYAVVGSNTAGAST
jgi:hypothetical protein